MDRQHWTDCRRPARSQVMEDSELAVTVQSAPPTITAGLEPNREPASERVAGPEADVGSKELQTEIYYILYR